ncbi:MAG: sulfotransferase family 2 domain-containing protein, partial [Phycisphaerae bacterium]|nr:sulfotransferase family protein [Phycisphaerae bacterium]NIT73496.1 sulfotransferase family protein [candidate division KSB1 bacterium]NIV01906.1 sulfotransferase family 2 domain-containing protein [Phycisphaerae bacterium]NIW21256.1 sulfotransferase family 2 domain-containing protein [candidate division KSB1 bacterium]NIX73176.1 sulfotransferase family 2 domain-containing protein [candidate division KSB1 bacterium]
MRTLPGNPSQLDKRSRLIQFFLSKVNRIPLLPSNGRYNLTISHQHKFIWFRVAKVATRTILNHFQTNQIHLDVEHAGFIFYPPGLFTSYFKFAFVRNPWDRLVSCWLDKVIQSNFYHFEAGKYEKMKEFE